MNSLSLFNILFGMPSLVVLNILFETKSLAKSRELELFRKKLKLLNESLIYNLTGLIYPIIH